MYITGYSLGGLNAAFVTHGHEQDEANRFRKLSLLNPPVDLYTSACMLDDLVAADERMKTRTFSSEDCSKGFRSTSENTA